MSGLLTTTCTVGGHDTIFITTFVVGRIPWNERQQSFFDSEKVLHEYFEKYALKHRNETIIYQAEQIASTCHDIFKI